MRFCQFTQDLFLRSFVHQFFHKMHAHVVTKTSETLFPCVTVTTLGRLPWPPGVCFAMRSGWLILQMWGLECLPQRASKELFPDS